MVKLNNTWLIRNEETFSNTLKICTYDSVRRNPVLNKMFFNFEQVQIYEFSGLSAFVTNFVKFVTNEFLSMKRTAPCMTDMSRNRKVSPRDTDVTLGRHRRI